MKRYIEYLKEKFHNALTINGKFVEIFKHPTSKEISDLLQFTKQEFNIPVIRMGVIDLPKPIIYVWRGDITHYDLKQWVPTTDFDFRYQGDKPKNKLWTDSPAGTNMSKGYETRGAVASLKNYKAVVKAIGKLFPKEKTLQDGLSFVYDTKTGSMIGKYDFVGNSFKSKLFTKEELTSKYFWNWQPQWIANIEKGENIKIKEDK